MYQSILHTIGLQLSKNNHTEKKAIKYDKFPIGEHPHRYKKKNKLIQISFL